MEGSKWHTVFKKHEKLIANIEEKVSRDQLPVFPKRKAWFRALEYLEPNEVKVVLLGLDPYHQKGQAIGFSFAVSKTCKTPPSLRNILKELKNEGFETSSNQITKWIKQKVLLLNAYLTVSEGKSKSYKEWYPVTLDLLKLVLKYNENCVFLLLGKDAEAYSNALELNNANVVITSHPSPLSANRGFLGSNCFRKVQEKIGGNFTWNI